MSDIYPVSIKLGSKTGSMVIREAKRLGRSASSSGTQSAYSISEGFVLKASKAQGVYNVYVIDIPGFIMLKGDTVTGTDGPNPSVPGPMRDDLTAGTNGVDRQVVTQGREANKYIPPPDPDPTAVPIHTSERRVWAMHEWQANLFSNGMMLLPFTVPVGGGFYELDSYFAFPKANVVTITTQFTNFRYSALAQGVAVQKNNPYAQSSFCLSEAQLPAGWLFFPRRLVPETQYRANQSDDYATARYVEPYQYGFSWAPAADSSASTPVHVYCVAREIANQDQALWKGRQTAYNPDYYDRVGQRALGVFLAELDPAAYNSTQQLATLTDQFMIEVSDLPDYLQPFPVLSSTYDPGTGLGHDIKRSGNFYAPRVLRCTEGFVVFSVYRTSQQEAGTTAVGTVNLTSVLSILPDRSVAVLKADKASWPVAGPTPDLPNFEPDHSVWPWIMGGFSVPLTAENGIVTRTAYALVWEQWMAANNNGNTADYPNGTGIRGGQWALYAFEQGAPTRTVLAEDGASASTLAPLLVATLAVAWPVFNVGSFSQGSIPYEDYKAKDYSSFCYAGGGCAVTPAIDKPFPVQSIGGNVEVITEDLTPHAVKCGFIDLEAGTITLRGSIVTDRSHSYERFYITVVQPYVRADAETGKAAIEPVLLASSHNTSNSNTSATGKTWLSIDGGWTWNLYFNDSGADIGAYYVGNDFWDYDPLETFTAL